MKVRLGKILQYFSLAVLVFTMIMGDEMPGVIPEPWFSIAKYAAIALFVASIFVSI